MNNPVLEFVKQKIENQSAESIKASLSHVQDGIKEYQNLLKEKYPDTDFHFMDDFSLPLEQLELLNKDDRRNYTELVGRRNSFSMTLQELKSNQEQ